VPAPPVSGKKLLIVGVGTVGNVDGGLPFVLVQENTMREIIMKSPNLAMGELKNL